MKLIFARFHRPSFTIFRRLLVTEWTAATASSYTVYITQTVFNSDSRHADAVFSARRYASAVYATALCLCLCLSVYPSVTSQCSTKMAQWIELIFDMEASFHLSYTVL